MPFYTHDNVPDSPINNFATLNRLSFAATNNLLNGNLQADLSSTNSGAKPTIILPKTGAWYAEFYALKVTGGLGYSTAGIMEASKLGWHGGPEISTPQSYSYDNSNFRDGAVEMGQTSIFTASNHSYNSGFGRISTGGVYGLLWDSDLKKFSILHNSNVCSVILAYDDIYDLVFHVSQSYGNATDKHIFNFGQDPYFAGAKSPTTTYPDANGIGQFYYEPPTGALALCTANLPEGPIKLSQDQTPSDNFKAVTYTGDYSSPATISVGFNPDLVWIKQRTPYDSQSHCIYDSVRGVSKRLYSDSTLQEITPDGNGGVTNFSDNNGFELTRPTNQAFEGHNSSMQMIAWCWKAGGAPTADNTATSGAMNANGSAATSSNSSVSINGVLQSNYTPAGSPTIYPKRMSINTNAGFSIVKWQASNGSDKKIPHGLSNSLDMIVMKNLDAGTYSWHVSHVGLTTNHNVLLNDTGESFNAATGGWVEIGTGGVFNIKNGTIGTNTNNGTDNYIAYCWHSVAGYSKFGSYVGNGSPDGPFVYTGFRVRWLMVKRTDSNGAWVIKGLSDSNPLTSHLNAATSAAEYTTNILEFDFLSNGYKIRNNNAGSNATNGKYIFMAFSEQPFSGPSNAR